MEETIEIFRGELIGFKVEWDANIIYTNNIRYEKNVNGRNLGIVV